MGRAKERHTAALAELEKVIRRREADDLPKDRPEPSDAAAARAMAAEIAAELEQILERAHTAEEARREQEDRASEAEREMREQRVLAGKLRNIIVEGSGLELPEVPPSDVPATANDAVRKTRLAEIYTDPEHLARVILALISAFSCFLKDEDFYIDGIEPDGISSA